MAEPTGVETPAEDTAYSAPEFADDEFRRRGSPVGVHQRVFGGRRAARRAPSGDHRSRRGPGRRKEAIARVRIVPGTGQWKINGRTLDVYFPNKVHQQIVSEPFVTLGAEGKFDVIARIGGGGVTGQAGALRLGVARALILVDPENRPPLKKAGFLTRDARVTERKKYGLKKARKAPQYSKR